MRVKVKSEVIQTSFLMIERREMFVGEKEGRFVELVDDQNPGSEAPSRSRIGGSEGDVSRGAMEKNRCVRVIKGKKVRDDPIEYFLSTGVRSISLSPRGGDGS